MIFRCELFVQWKPYIHNKLSGFSNMVFKRYILIQWYYSYLDSSSFAIQIQIAVIPQKVTYIYITQPKYAFPAYFVDTIY